MRKQHGTLIKPPLEILEAEHKIRQQDTKGDNKY